MIYLNHKALYLGIDPSKLLNPVPEEPSAKPVQRDEGPVAQTFVADYPEDDKETVRSEYTLFFISSIFFGPGSSVALVKSKIP